MIGIESRVCRLLNQLWGIFLRVVAIYFLIPCPLYAANWYVNDNNTTGDIFTTSVGNDVNSGSASDPFLTINKAISVASPGDTIFIDVGTFNEIVTINFDNLSLIGVDSSATGTVISLTIQASQKVGLLIKNLRVDIIYWTGVSNSHIEGVEGHGGPSFNLNECSNNLFNNNVCANGIQLINCPNNTITHNIVNSSLDEGGSQISEGLLVEQSSGNNIISNTIFSNLNGMLITNCSDNRVINNTFISNNTAIIILAGCINTIVANNLISSNNVGIFINSNPAEVNIFSQNDISGNPFGGVQFWDDASGSIFSKNNITDDVLIFRTLIAPERVFVRNWWGTTDSQAIQNRLMGTGASLISYIPFRLGIVDTASNVDTIAPFAPDIVAVDTSGGRITLRWNAVTTNEEGVPYTGDLGGYRIYRDTASNPNRRTPIASVSATETSFVDTGVSDTNPVYYVLTSFDTRSPYPNESFYGAESSAVVMVNTPVGNQVAVTFPAEDVTVTFASVTSAGVTTVSRISADTPIPGFEVADCNPDKFFVITTTATFTTARVEVIYDPSCFVPPPSINQQKMALRLLHFNGVPPDPDDVTQSNQLGQNKLTSIPLSSFSPFVVAVPVVKAMVRVEPQTLEQKSATRGNGVLTLFVEGIEDAMISDIIPESVRLLGASPIRSELAGGQGKPGGRLLLQYRRGDLDLSQLIPGTITSVDVTGILQDGRRMRGTAAIFLRGN